MKKWPQCVKCGKQCNSILADHPGLCYLCYITQKDSNWRKNV